MLHHVGRVDVTGRNRGSVYDVVMRRLGATQHCSRLASIAGPTHSYRRRRNRVNFDNGDPLDGDAETEATSTTPPKVDGNDDPVSRFEFPDELSLK